MGRSNELAPLLSVNAEEPLGLELPSGNTGFLACVFNLANVAMGAGVLAFPYAMQICGYATGIAIAVGAATLMCATLQVVAKCSDAAYELAAKGKASVTNGSYQEIVVAILGPRAGKAMTWLILIYLTLSNIAYITIMYDQTKPIISSTLGDDSIFTKKEVLVPLCGGLVGYPLALIPNMNVFAIPSTLSQVGIIFAVGLVAYYGFSNISENQSAPTYDKPLKLSKANPLDLIESFPLIAFSFQCHITFPLIYASLKNRTVGRISGVNIVCVYGCLLIYLIMGIAGYVLLGEATPDDILVGICGSGNYYDDKMKCCMPMPMDANSTLLQKCPDKMPIQVMALVARACVFIKVACSYGMLVFVSRTCVQDILMPVGKKFNRFQHHLETVLYVAVTIGVGMAPITLSVPMEFAGVLVVIIDILFPGLMKLKISRTQKDKIISYILVVVGIVAAALCIVSAVAKQTEKK